MLDEPSIGLHQRDNDRLLRPFEELSDLGNTLLVVEHDEDTLRQADWLCDLGPGAGLEGGVVVANGTPDEVMASQDSITGAYLSGRKSIPWPDQRTKPGKRHLKVKGAQHNNLQNIDVAFPIGCMTAVTGVSGSGKSSLVSGILAPALAARFTVLKPFPDVTTSLSGVEHVDKVIIIDQSPIGRTPRSNPATYTKVFDEIRALFANTKLSKERGYKRGTLVSMSKAADASVQRRGLDQTRNEFPSRRVDHLRYLQRQAVHARMPRGGVAWPHHPRRVGNACGRSG